mgnify:CR=1 FL=1
MIMRCDCLHEYQDSVYGNFSRVHNLNKVKTHVVRTVCGDKKSVSNGESISKESKKKK